MYRSTAALVTLAAAVRAQQAGTLQTETHPSMSWSTCSGTGGKCTSKAASVVIDANWRWTHSTSGSNNCYTGNTWDKSLCPDNASGAKNCAVDGANYASTYGITTSGNSMKMNFVTQSSGKNIGSRTYLMADDSHYATFNLLGNEFSFDVDVSNLGCGLNGALYFVSMPADGGISSTNKAGAKYGTGYCDSQCPRDLKFIGGQANCEGWQPSTSDSNSGVGNHGSCCPEMDIWEANSVSAAYTPHPCTSNSPVVCSGDACGGTYSSDRYAGECDPDGCDFNSYRMGNTSFYGKGKIVDTSKVFTVVTQFVQTSGKLSAIKRYYVQNGKVIANSQSNIAGISGNSITDDFCKNQKSVFGDNTDFQTKGGLAAMGSALGNMVLVMSVWDDHHSNMLWLDSEAYPVDGDPSKPGIARGSCDTTSGNPATIESSQASNSVTYSNIRFGPIGSTTSQTLSG